MFHFINLSDFASTDTYEKGKLFEALVEKIVDECGYTNIKLRRKRASLEYDITATGKLDGKGLVGEAKAKVEKIAGHVFSSFAGKMIPYWDEDPKTLGLFISTSELTGEAEDYHRTIEKKNIKTIIGDEILKILSKELGYYTIKQVKAISEKRFGMRSGDTYLLVSDRGDYFIQLLIHKSKTLPTAFCVLHKDGELIDDHAFGDEVKRRIPELKELKIVTSDKEEITETAPGGITAPAKGEGWFDYKFPAPPECFIGRTEWINKFFDFTKRIKERDTNTTVFEILSRSGVGKSSYALKVQDDVEKQGNFSIICDARNIRTTIDVLGIFQEFIQRINNNLEIPRSFNEIQKFLIKADEILNKNDTIGFVFIDQFEAMFSRPELFIQFVDIIQETMHTCKSIIFCLTRKNDQPTTYDERASIDIDLSKLRQMSEHILLEDFTKDEAFTLVEKIEYVKGIKLKKELKYLIMKTSDGFPWLHKRLCAHVIQLMNLDYSQAEIINMGLRLVDLFEEELAALDEIEKDFLKRIAHYLPATMQELSEIFEEGKMLSKHLQALQNQRLIRLTGSTYDTYNDFFKEYLKTGTIPLRTKFIFRTTPKATLDLLNQIIDDKLYSITELQQRTNKQLGSLYNTLRDLRMLGLVDYAKDTIRVDSKVEMAYRENNLEKLIRERTKSNAPVSDIRSKLNLTGSLDIGDIKSILKDNFPFGDDVRDETWTIYAKHLVGWIYQVGLAKRRGYNLFLSNEGEKISVVPVDPSSRIFLPNQYTRKNLLVVNFFKEKKTASLNECRNTFGQTVEKAIIDLKAIGFLMNTYNGDMTLSHGGMEFANMDDFAKQKRMKELLLSKSNIKDYVDLLEKNPKIKHVEILKEVMNRYPKRNWTDETWQWRSKVLANWLEYSQLLSRKAGKISKQKGMQMLLES
jgi:hypothetical protein